MKLNLYAILIFLSDIKNFAGVNILDHRVDTLKQLKEVVKTFFQITDIKIYYPLTMSFIKLFFIQMKK